MNHPSEKLFKKLFHMYQWRPIHGCPGRFTMRGGVSPLSIQELIGQTAKVAEEIFPNAKDSVLYCAFEDGGIISYKKETGYLHTLCNKEGFAKKMAELKKTPLLKKDTQSFP